MPPVESSPKKQPSGEPHGGARDNAVVQAILTRRSVRRYRPGGVDDALLETIVDCGRMAPTANNSQTWEFVVITAPDRLARLADLAPHGRFIRDAAACIVVVGDLATNRSLYLDGAAATENMLLAIHALGLASCWVQGYEKPYGPEILRMVGAPATWVLVSLLPVAHAEAPAATPRKRPLAEVLHRETLRRPREEKG